MFSQFLVNAWIVGSMVAIAAGLVGFFAVMRGASFASHAIPQGAFAGAAGATLIGVSALAGLGVFALAGALVIALLGRRGRHDVVVALSFVLMLGLGALFLSMSTEYAPEVFALLFGEILGVSRSEILPSALLVLGCALAVAGLYRPLLFSSVLPEVAEGRGVRAFAAELGFLVLVAAATTATVPIVGALLMFSLMIAPAASARLLTSRPGVALCLSAALSLVTLWASIASAYATNWPIGFFVGAFGAGIFLLVRTAASVRSRLTARPAPQPATAVA
ncbi:MAG: metal ABC transporter permease [Acidimicrobiales bacterium]